MVGVVKENYAFLFIQKQHFNPQISQIHTDFYEVICFTASSKMGLG